MLIFLYVVVVILLTIANVCLLKRLEGGVTVGGLIVMTTVSSTILIGVIVATVLIGVIIEDGGVPFLKKRIW